MEKSIIQLLNHALRASWETHVSQPVNFNEICWEKWLIDKGKRDLQTQPLTETRRRVHGGRYSTCGLVKPRPNNLVFSLTFLSFNERSSLNRSSELVSFPHNRKGNRGQRKGQDVVGGRAGPGCFPSGNWHESNTAPRPDEYPLKDSNDGSPGPCVVMLIRQRISSSHLKKKKKYWDKSNFYSEWSIWGTSYWDQEWTLKCTTDSQIWRWGWLMLECRATHLRVKCK